MEKKNWTAELSVSSARPGLIAKLASTSLTSLESTANVPIIGISWAGVGGAARNLEYTTSGTWVNSLRISRWFIREDLVPRRSSIEIKATIRNSKENSGSSIISRDPVYIYNQASNWVVSFFRFRSVHPPKNPLGSLHDLLYSAILYWILLYTRSTIKLQ